MYRGTELLDVLRLMVLLCACQAGLPRRHLDSLRQEVLHSYGHGDNYTPPATSRVFAGALHGEAAQDTVPPASWFDAMLDLGEAVVTAFPIANNLNANGKPLTVVTVQALNDPADAIVPGTAYDGHFIMFDDKVIQNQGMQFLATLAQGAPIIVK